VERGQWEQGGAIRGGEGGGTSRGWGGEGVGEGRAQAEGGMVGDGDLAAVLAQSASVKKTHSAAKTFQRFHAAFYASGTQHGTSGMFWLQSMLDCLGQHI